MRNIIAITQVTLDGVMQSPGGPEEDPRNGFTHGGWAMPFLDDALNQAIGETIAAEFDMLLGRRTYEIFAAYWPNQGDNPIAKAFNKATKYVVTRTLDQFEWQNSLHIGGDVVDEVRRLKASDGLALHIWGSSELLQTLIAGELVDEYRIWVFPLVLGEESGCSRTAFLRAASLWSRREARPRASSSTPTAPPVRSKPGRSDWKRRQKRNSFGGRNWQFADAIESDFIALVFLRCKFAAPDDHALEFRATRERSRQR
jgi:dihydrofolate reductase